MQWRLLLQLIPPRRSSRVAAAVAAAAAAYRISPAQRRNGRPITKPTPVVVMATEGSRASAMNDCGN